MKKTSHSRHPGPVDVEVAPRARPSMPPTAMPTASAAHVAAHLRAHDASWLAAAMALQPAEVEVCRADTQIVSQNLRATAENLTEAAAELAARGVVVDAERLAATSALALALASARVPRERRVSGAQSLLREIAPLRRAFVADAARQVEKKRLDAAEVDPLLTSDGGVDQVRTLRALTALYHAHASTLTGHTTIDADDLRRAESLTDRALERLRMAASHRGVPGDARAAAADLRNRFWTLAKRHHAWMECIAGAAWGSKLRTHVPPLEGGRRAARARAAAPVPPNPATP